MRAPWTSTLFRVNGKSAEMGWLMMAPLARPRRAHCLRIVPQVVRQLAGAQSHQPISQYFESRKRPVCDRALQQQSVLVVGQELQGLELVSFDRALPSEEGSLRGRTRRDRRDSASTSQ